MSALDATDGTAQWVGDAGSTDPNYPTDLIQSAVTSMRGLALYEYLRMRLVRPMPVAAPAAGAEWSVTVGPNVIWEVLAVQFQLVTSAAVANRNAMLRVTDNLNAEAFRVGPQAVQAASLTNTYSYLPGFGYASGTGRQQVGWPSPPPVLLPGYVLGTTTSAIDVGDQYSLVELQVREWSVGQVYWLSDLIARELGFETLTDLPTTTPVPIATGQAAHVTPLAR